VHSGIIPYKGPNHQYRVQACGNFEKVLNTLRLSEVKKEVLGNKRKIENYK